MANVIVDFDTKNNILRATIEGRLTDEILLGFWAIARQRLMEWSLRHAIIDLTSVTEFEVSHDAIKRLAVSPPLASAGEVRILVIQKDFIYGAGRMFQILTERHYSDLHLVRTIDEAYRLLQMKCSEFRPVS